MSSVRFILHPVGIGPCSSANCSLGSFFEPGPLPNSDPGSPTSAK
ncbi:hypothetical protein LEMLEM_LOCUS23911, partial [Lemmus lemmus]